MNLDTNNHLVFSLYFHLLDLLKNKEVHSIIGCITQPNESSVALHELSGFKKVAHFKK